MSYAIGDMFYADTINSLALIHIGSSNQVLTVKSGVPSWQNASNSSARSQSSVSRSLNSAFQVSATRDSLVRYSVDISCTSTLISGQSGTVILEMATNSGFTTGVQTLSQFTNSNSVALAIAITVIQINTACVTGYVPAGNYVRLRTVNNTGTPTYTYQVGQEVLM